MKKCIEGQIVHYVLHTRQGESQHRGAIITRVWDQTLRLVNLSVFLDWLNDAADAPGIRSDVSQAVVWATSVRYSENKEQGTWHFIEDDNAS